ncbi:MAG: DNA primase [Flavobacteriales bacterium]
MIPQQTIDQILDAALIEEVIGEFVQLKRAGSSFKGLSPFSNEKTPSFYVSPGKGIFKDFSSGKGGNVVSFLMEHERMTYPEALRFLADKYQIEIEEELPSEEVVAERSERENLGVVMSYAQKFFTDELWNSDEGKAVGLSYFQQRGFRDDIINKFQLGYHPEGWENFTKKALADGYDKEYLISSGLTKQKEERLYDFFRGRVMFPIRNITGKVIAFGGRTLKSDKKIAKYFNSPEHALYNKSKVLYGIYFAKNIMVKEDQCYLVEGYTDVIALHQAGVENVVSSSGTSLTEGQIKLIKRYTNNITMLYDGDAAGIKASFRGIDLILAQGLNVKVVLFPDGEDPDSFSRKVSSTELQDYIAKASKDFLTFKTDILLEDAQGDPIKRAQLIRQVVESISKIPDGIQRSVYVQQCSTQLNVSEQVLNSELNKILRSGAQKQHRESSSTPPPPPPLEQFEEGQKPKGGYRTEPQERDLIRLLMHYGNFPVHIEVEEEQEGKQQMEKLEISVAEYLCSELEADQFNLKNPVYAQIVALYETHLHKEEFPDHKVFTLHADQKLSSVAAEVLAEEYELSGNWEAKHQIYPETEDMKLNKAVRDCVNRLKLSNVMIMIHEIQEEIKTVNEDDLLICLDKKRKLDKVKQELSKYFGSSVL